MHCKHLCLSSVVLRFYSSIPIWREGVVWTDRASVGVMGSCFGRVLSLCAGVLGQRSVILVHSFRPQNFMLFASSFEPSHVRYATHEMILHSCACNIIWIVEEVEPRDIGRKPCHVDCAVV